MCGIFGFAGAHIDRELLLEVSSLASKRGPHAFGFVSNDLDTLVRFPGSMTPEAAEQLGLLPPPFIIGHARLATSGDYHRQENNQPQVHRPVAVVHNGNIPDWQSNPLAAMMASECDSELLAITLARRTPVDAFDLFGEAPFAFLAVTPAGLILGRRHLPLWRRRLTGGVYFCSVEFDGSEQVPENRLLLVNWPAVIPLHVGGETRPPTRSGWTPSRPLLGRC